jgi:5-methylcytosine-specific restriction endonuclease McrA
MNQDDYGRRSHSWKKLRKRVLQQSDVCWLCGQSGSDTVDHIIPRSIDLAAAENMDNLRPAHRSCNSARGNRTPAAVDNLRASRNW